MQKARAKNHEIQKSVRQLEIENRNFMQVVENIQKKMQLLIEDHDQHESTASQDINRNITKSKNIAWTAHTEKHDFPYNVPYSVPKSLSSSIQQDKIKLSNDRDGIHSESETFDPDMNLVNDIRNMLVQKGKNESESSVFMPLTAKRESRKSARVADPTTAVAFHTRLSTDLTNPGDDQTIIMSDVLTNEGSAYDSSTGYFTCTESGVYVFFVTTLAFPNKHIETMLLKNGHSIGMLISGNSDTWGPSSNMVIVTAQKGDHVWVRVNDHYHDTGTVLHQRFTTYSLKFNK